MSAPSAIWKPPPRQLPWTAAITGTGSVTQSYAVRWKRFGTVMSASSSPPFRPASPENALDTSIPEQKLGPSPCRTTARTPGVAATSSAASTIAANIAWSSALCFSGRASVTVATWSLTSTRTRSVRRHRGELIDPAVTGSPTRIDTGSSTLP